MHEISIPFYDRSRESHNRAGCAIVLLPLAASLTGNGAIVSLALVIVYGRVDRRT